MSLNYSTIYTLTLKNSLSFLCLDFSGLLIINGDVFSIINVVLVQWLVLCFGFCCFDYIKSSYKLSNQKTIYLAKLL